MQMHGTAKRIGENYELRFERKLSHSADDVWQALTSPESVSDWIGGPGSTVELTLGGRVTMPEHGGIDSTITELEPGRVIAYGWKTDEWDGGTIRWEVTPDGDGSTLVVTHNMPPVDKQFEKKMIEQHGLDPDEYPTIPRTMAGWHTLIEQLVAHIEGRTLDDDYWKNVFEEYRSVTA